MTSFKFYLSASLILLSLHSNAAGGSKPLETRTPEANEVFEQTIKGQLTALQLSLDSGFDINQVNKKGESLLMTAAGNGHKEITKYLISKKANLNTKDQEQKSALYYAIVNEQPETANLLIEAGVALKSQGKPIILIFPATGCSTSSITFTAET